jgi:hypothetical protein
MTASESKRAYNVRERTLYHEYVRIHGAINGGQKGFRVFKSGLPIFQRPISYLSTRQQFRRQNALLVLSKSRRSQVSLSAASSAGHIAPETVRRYTAAFRKQGGRWIPTKRDRIQRWLKSYERGSRTEVLVDDSRTATLISKYAHAIGEFLVTRDENLLGPFRTRIYTDAAGRAHSFETRPEAIVSAVERSESDFGEFADLYSEQEVTTEAS